MFRERIYDFKARRKTPEQQPVKGYHGIIVQNWYILADEFLRK